MVRDNENQCKECGQTGRYCGHNHCFRHNRRLDLCDEKCKLTNAQGIALVSRWFPETIEFSRENARAGLSTLGVEPDLFFSEEQMERDWNNALELLREEGLDPDEVIQRAAQNLEAYRKLRVMSIHPDNLINESLQKIREDRWVLIENPSDPKLLDRHCIVEIPHPLMQDTSNGPVVETMGEAMYHPTLPQNLIPIQVYQRTHVAIHILCINPTGNPTTFFIGDTKLPRFVVGVGLVEE